MIIKKWTRERIELKEKEEIIKKEGREEGGGRGGCGGKEEVDDMGEKRGT